MSGASQYIYLADMDIDPAKEDIFNEVYDAEHLPLLMRVPGVMSARRYRLQPLTVSIGGEAKRIVAEGEPRYSAVYEVESPSVLVSDAWAEAVDRGRWPKEVRPYIRNRRLVLRRLLEPRG